MMRLRYLNYLLIPMALLMLISCSDSNPDAPTDQSAHPLSWLNPLAAENHGTEAVQNGNESCKSCHGADLTGSGSVPGCYDCHFDPSGSKVPQGSSWTHGTLPHDQFAVLGETCNTCHGIYRQHAELPEGCHDCHPGTNHPVGQAWLDKNSTTFHGLEAALDSNQCTSCHGVDFQGGVSGLSCYYCHFGPTGSRVPVGVTWTHGTIPHDSLTDYIAVCNQCHSVNRDFGNAPSTCHDCHGSGTTHATGQAWLDKNSATFHGIFATEDLTQCATCHGADYLGGITGVSCSQCHFGPDGGKVPDSVVWTHGATPHDVLTPYISVCNQCHTLNRDYGNGPSTCHDCHGSGASHATGQTWLDKNSATFHGLDAAQDLTQCAVCHGADYLGGISGVSCSQCHFGPTGSRVPPGVNWSHGLSSHDDQEAYVNVCNQCHDLNKSYGNEPLSCHNCH